MNRNGRHSLYSLENKRNRCQIINDDICLLFSIPSVTYFMEQREVAKWEDRDNDIVALAKHMCRIMMDMADFIKGRGKLKTTQVEFHMEHYNFTLTNTNLMISFSLTKIHLFPTS